VRTVEETARGFLEDLLKAHGPSGHEEPAAAVWRSYCRRFASVSGDVLGNSYARVGPDQGPAALLLGHIDEIGLLVTHIEHDGDIAGLLRVRAIGTWDPQVLAGHHVVIRARSGNLVPGVVGRVARHLLSGEQLETALTIPGLWVDIGARDAQDAEQRVAVGDPLVCRADPVALPNGRLAGRALDNRTGAWVVAEAARRAAGRLRVPVVAGAPVLEETLMDGGRAMAHAVAPAVTVVVDVTHTSDVPGIDTGTTSRIRIGAGPVLNRGTGLHPGLTERFATVARDAGIPLQTEALHLTGSTQTDVDGALDAHAGSAIALLALPLRHMHTPGEVCSLDDIEAAADLLARVLETLTPEDRWER
jgi:putative aminopeptidase FrvX